MRLSDWGISACFIFWGTYKQISLSMAGSGNYLFYIIMHLDLDLAHYYSALHLTIFRWKKKRAVTWMCWMMLFHEIVGEKVVKHISTQHLCPRQENRLFLPQSCSGLPFFWCSLPACWRHQLMPEVQLSFPSCMYYRQRQMETWNCWPQLLDHVSIFRFLQGSCILQNSSVNVSWYVTLEEGF